MPTIPRLAIALFGLLVAAAPAFAEPPAGDYAIPVSDPEIFVPSGLVEESCATTERITICATQLSPIELVPGVELPMINGSGVITARLTGRLEGDLTADAFGGEVLGRLKGPVGRAAARMRMNGNGPIAFGGIVISAVAKGAFRCAPGPTTATLDCVSRVQLCAFESGRKIGCVAEPLPVTVQQTGGPWQLRFVDLETDENGVVTGKGEVEIATGRVFTYAVSGKYDAGEDASSLIVRGTAIGGTSLLKLSHVTLAAGSATGGKLVFRIAGQTGKLELPSGAPP